MKRSQPLARSPLPPRTEPIRRVNRARRGKAFARAYGSAERVAWVRSLSCVVCGGASTDPIQRVENAHVRTGGMGRKADAALIVPLCSPHHQSLHKRGIAAFQARYGVDLVACAADTEARWQHAQRSPTPQHGA